MLLGIDHIVIAVPDLETAIKNYRRLGFTVVPGGRHPVGTYNGLIAFADGSYIELIAFYRENPQHRWWGALQKGGGLVDFCMQTDDLAGDTAKLRNAGVEIDDPVPWSRTRPDGYQLKWLLSLARGEHRGVAPFLIQDETPREERIPREQKHKNGVTGIGTVTVAADDLPGVRRWYRSVLDYDGTEIISDDLRARGVSFEIGPHCCYFAQPIDEESPLAECLKMRGPSLYAATLRSNSRNPPALDVSLTHGARLSYE
jgi:catechol 2,3-dioxygenase-like lactoylglutathione lyase family enzyme